jgi:hypothetical protein
VFSRVCENRSKLVLSHQTRVRIPVALLNLQPSENPLQQIVAIFGALDRFGLVALAQVHIPLNHREARPAA